jgi:aminoglycoside/choline kinase family phosphotransferase
MNRRAALTETFISRAGWSDAQRSLVAGDASNRRYDRLRRADGSTAILMDAPPDRGEDVHPFIKVAGFLTDQGFSAPEIYHQDCSNGYLLIEDLGDARFAELMARDPARIPPLYRAAVDVLVQLHRCDPANLAPCDADWLIEMTAPFFDYYAPEANTRLNKDIITPILPLAKQVATGRQVVILRDYHAENLLWLPQRVGIAKVGLLDFQDALLGHPAYDLVSILQDARRDVAADTEATMIDHYLSQAAVPSKRFRTAYATLGLQRNLRILGIFARLCLRDGKAQYVDMIPRVWGYVMRNLAHPALTPVKDVLAPALPRPSPEFLEQLKSRCANTPKP